MYRSHNERLGGYCAGCPAIALERNRMPYKQLLRVSLVSRARLQALFCRPSGRRAPGRLWAVS